MRHESVTWLDRWQARIERRLQLARGRWARWRGVHSGDRFGLGAQVELLFPRCLFVGDDVTIEGPGFLHCLSKRGVRIGRNTSIARNLWLHCGNKLGGYTDGWVEIGDHSFIGCNAVLGAGGGIHIGSHVLIGQCVNIHAENHVFIDPQRLIREQGVNYRGVTIEDDVWIGSKTTILDGVTVSQGAVIGAGAVVTQNVPALAVVVGVPAHVIRWRNQEM